MISFLWSLFIYTVFLWCRPPNNKYLLELIKRRSKVQERNMSCERGLNFDQWKTFPENYKPVRIWLWLLYKFTIMIVAHTTFLRVHSNSKEVSLDKISILTWKLLVISTQNFSCELNSQRTYSLQNISYLSLRL